MAQYEEEGLIGDTIYKYNFYRAIDIVSEGIIHWSKRYARECERLAAIEENPERKAELLRMADTLDWIIDLPLPQLPRRCSVHLSVSALNVHGRSAARHKLRPR